MKRALAIFAICAALAPSAMSGTFPEGRAPARFQIAQAGDFAPLEQVLRQVAGRYPGRQLSVSGPSPSGGGYVYRIKWLTQDGAVLYIVADAESGAILSVDGG